MLCNENVKDTEKVGIDFISYIVNSIKLLEAKKLEAKKLEADISTMVSNLSMAIVLQLFIMEVSGVNFREESVASLNSSEICSAIRMLTYELCIAHPEGKYYYVSLFANIDLFFLPLSRDYKKGFT